MVRNDKVEFKYAAPAPQVGIAAKMLEQMTRIGAEFGWAPAARARLQVSGKQKRSLDQIAKERAQANRAAWEREQKKKGS